MVVLTVAPASVDHTRGPAARGSYCGGEPGGPTAWKAHDRELGDFASGRGSQSTEDVRRAYLDRIVGDIAVAAPL
ncbi:hypothetical protein R0K18_27820, partial [Pantoea sp. SIMBA_133]